jgi:hypothetical protein
MGLPEQPSIYIDWVFDKITTLIKYGVWENIDLDRFNKWKAQFITIEDRYYAAYLAQQMVYYNKKDFIALISRSYAESIKQIAYDLFQGLECQDDDSWEACIKNVRENTLICPFSPDPSSSSGNMVIRLLRDIELISEWDTCWGPLEDLIEKANSKKYKAIIFVDDMIGSGVQALEFFVSPVDTRSGRIVIKRFLSDLDIKTYLSVAVSSSDSVKRIERITNLKISVAELLTNKNDVLKEEFWHKDIFDYRDGMEFLRRIEQKYKVPRSSFKEGAWSLAFEHGVPDVSLPFYWDKNKSWTSLVPVRGVDVL